MKHLHVSVVFSSNAWRCTGTWVMLMALLAGCGGNRPEIKKEEIQAVVKKEEKQAEIKKEEIPPEIKNEKNPATQPPEVTPQTRADFDAAMSFIKAGEYDKGIALLNKVTEGAKNNPVPYANLALAYQKTGNAKLAEENFKMALSVEPGNPVASNEYARLQRKAGKFKEARQLYEQALNKHPDFQPARKNLGILCDLYLRDYECALKQYEAYSSAKPEDKAVKIWISDVQNRMGRKE